MVTTNRARSSGRWAESLVRAVISRCVIQSTSAPQLWTLVEEVLRRPQLGHEHSRKVFSKSSSSYTRRGDAKLIPAVGGYTVSPKLSFVCTYMMCHKAPEPQKVSLDSSRRTRFSRSRTFLPHTMPQCGGGRRRRAQDACGERLTDTGVSVVDGEMM